MPKKETKKNIKGSKETTKKTVAKKTTKKTAPKKVVEEKKVETVKPVVNEKKKGKIKSLVEKIMSNTPFVISLCIIIILLATLIFILCTKRIPKTSEGDDIIATINGKTITAEDLYKELKEANGTDSLINIIDSYIADKEVEITDEDKEYVQQIVDYYKEYAEYYNTDLATFLSNYVGLTDITTEKEFSEYVLKDYKKTLAVQKFIGDNAKEDDLKEYYKNNYSDTLTVKHILIEVDSEAEDQDKADKEAYESAVKLIQKLKKTDKDKLNDKFEELAKENSDDTETYSNGGLIEDFAKKDVEETFYEAASKLKDGEYTTEPVKTSYGYHVILKVSSKEVEKYDQIKDEVKKEYAKDLLQNDTTLQITKWDELRKQYKLSIKDDQIKEAYEKTIKNAKKNKTTTDDTNDTETEN